MDTLKNAFAIMVIGVALLFVFGARVIHGLIDLARWMGAN
jgi:hypothetical protein